MSTTEGTTNVQNCLTCEKQAIRRGLCHACYQSASSQIRRGTISWDRAEELGLSRPPRTFGAWMQKMRELTETAGDDQPRQDGAEPAEPGLDDD